MIPLVQHLAEDIVQNHGLQPGLSAGGVSIVPEELAEHFSRVSLHLFLVDVGDDGECH